MVPVTSNDIARTFDSIGSFDMLSTDAGVDRFNIKLKFNEAQIILLHILGYQDRQEV